jgi:hypothetical protein
MLTLSKQDFTLRPISLDLTNEWNILRLIAGAFMFPHILGKFIGWAPDPVTVGFSPRRVSYRARHGCGSPRFPRRWQACS